MSPVIMGLVSHLLLAGGHSLPDQYLLPPGSGAGGWGGYESLTLKMDSDTYHPQGAGLHPGRRGKGFWLSCPYLVT